MKKELTELVFIIDASGSMCNLEADTIGGFNGMIEKQKKERGEAIVSTVMFNTNSSVLHDRVDIEKIEPLTGNDYTTGGGTALLDAVGGAIHHIGNVHKYAKAEDVPEKTMVVIITDGAENSSHIYSYSQIKSMIERQKKLYNWEFIFLGANIDAAAAAESIGIDRDMAATYRSDNVGTTLNFEVVEKAICMMRTNRKIDKNWKQRIDEDVKKRGSR